MIRRLRKCTTVAIVLIAPLRYCSAADLQVTVVDSSGRPVSDVVVIAVPTVAVAPSRSGSQTTRAPAIMDQINKEFVPEILVVRAGTAVLFPNSDSVAHQVYSFSAAKHFALPLYRGRPHPPVIFDQPGIVVLGCNIHDHMIGYIVVSESPYYSQTDTQGLATLHTLPLGEYRIRIWHPRINEQTVEQSITISDATEPVLFRLTKPLRPAHHNSDSRIRDY